MLQTVIIEKLFKADFLNLWTGVSREIIKSFLQKQSTGGVLLIRSENFSEFTGKHLCLSLSFRSFQPAALLKRDFSTKFLRTPIS